MFLNRTIIDTIIPKVFYPGITRFIVFCNGENPCTFSCINKFTFPVQQLQCIPLSRVMAGREDNAGISFFKYDLHLNSRCG